MPFPSDMTLTPLSRKPLQLPPATAEAVWQARFPAATAGSVSPPAVSIVVVTHNNLVCTRLCLASILAHSDGPGYELIVVDNASTDGTTAFLEALARTQPHVQVISNAINRGFAAANNQGVERAAGEVIVLLNNDTLVPPDWLRRLVGYLREPAVGAVGPVTNRCGNEAEVEAPYATYGAFRAFAQDHMQRHAGRHFDIPMLTMFCVALRRDTWAHIGPLDERFEVGMFEDDDYALRLRAAGYRLVCAEDVYVHHFGGAAFGELAQRGAYGTLFHANRQRFEQKWNRRWQPHARRRSASYEECLAQVRTLVSQALPPQATVAVVSKGDEALLALEGRRAWHFPLSEEGGYAGYYPADSEEAIRQLEAVRARGATHLLLPQPALWWLEHYTGLRAHLEAHYPVCAHAEGAGMIITLNPCNNQSENAWKGKTNI